MPDTDYATMPAGLELNALIAEKVMGWRIVKKLRQMPPVTCNPTKEPDPSMFPFVWMAPLDCYRFRDNGDYCHYQAWGEGLVWSPSTDPAADYEVLCHVRERWDAGARDIAGSELVELLSSRVPEAYTLDWAPLWYRTGDYGRSALMALAEMGKDNG